MARSLVDIFNDYFEMVAADTDELKKEVYKLRYQVYCHEAHFEDPTDHPDGIEFDEYDSRSVHYLIYHRERQVYMATTRLILADANNPDKLFPVEVHCPIDNLAAIAHITRAHLAEASRFCISKNFRRRRNEMKSVMGVDLEPSNVFSQEERRIFPHLTLALFACLIKMSREHDVYDWLAVMEPALIRIFSTLGINFIEIGPLTDYHGKRRPCTIKVDDLLAGVQSRDVSSWGMLTNNGNLWN